jgi:hypothetical protein
MGQVTTHAFNGECGGHLIFARYHIWDVQKGGGTEVLAH